MYESEIEELDATWAKKHSGVEQRKDEYRAQSEKVADEKYKECKILKRKLENMKADINKEVDERTTKYAMAGHELESRTAKLQYEVDGLRRQLGVEAAAQCIDGQTYKNETWHITTDEKEREIEKIEPTRLAAERHTDKAKTAEYVGNAG